MTLNHAAGGVHSSSSVSCHTAAASSHMPPAIASNESFSGWTKTFTDPRLCVAIVDRLTFNGAIIQTGTESYRLAHTKAQAERAAAS
ncbi:IstB domain-containing protein ATP-binding protein [Streptomyces azureus]|uniref:IstB domain-containing protein ATP-binding protein n=1 Tax=Streptomyces azureus TaxID=146537 RepID=A0A0K8PS19_STRAJ|nr:IstB domain-containing protein ATP-binding protein [Streptomyces azureus]